MPRYFFFFFLRECQDTITNEHLSYEKEIPRVISYAKSIVEVLQNTGYVNNVISPILDDCRQLITRFQMSVSSIVSGKLINVLMA